MSIRACGWGSRIPSAGERWRRWSLWLLRGVLADSPCYVICISSLTRQREYETHAVDYPARHDGAGGDEVGGRKTRLKATVAQEEELRGLLLCTTG
jgi:hypothetical protein